jgi:hypothetical protein
MDVINKKLNRYIDHDYEEERILKFLQLVATVIILALAPGSYCG